MSRPKEGEDVVRGKLRSAQTMLSRERGRGVYLLAALIAVVERLSKEDCPNGIKNFVAGIVEEIEKREARHFAAPEEGAAGGTGSPAAGGNGQASQGETQ